MPFNINQAPENSLSFSLSKATPRWSGSFALNYRDPAFFTDVLDQRFYGPTSAYLMVNSSFHVRFLKERLELRLSGTNLLNEKIKQHVFGDEIRRKLSAELRYKF
ncbi:MAG: hypothetical protein AAF533_28660 [Acidobacteriota bacterium]